MATKLVQMERRGRFGNAMIANVKCSKIENPRNKDLSAEDKLMIAVFVMLGHSAYIN